MSAPAYLYRCEINAVPHAEDPDRTVYEWTVDFEGDPVAGGYGATREDAANDLRIWREAHAGPFTTTHWRALTADNRDFNFCSEAKARSFAAKCGGAYLGRMTKAELTDILTRAGLLKADVITGGEPCR